MRAVSYLRAVGRRRAGPEPDVEAQRSAIARFMADHGFEPVAEFVEAGTRRGGDLPDRLPGLAAALERAEAEGCPVVVATLGGLAREAAFLAGLAARRMPLIVAGLDAGPLVLCSYAALAEVERALGPAPIRSAANGRGGRDAIATRADQYAERVLPVIDDIRRQGARSLRQIAAQLVARDVPRPRGGAWTAAAVSAVLARRERLAGAAVMNGHRPDPRLRRPPP